MGGICGLRWGMWVQVGGGGYVGSVGGCSGGGYVGSGGGGLCGFRGGGGLCGFRWGGGGGVVQVGGSVGGGGQGIKGENVEELNGSKEANVWGGAQQNLNAI